MRFQSRSFEELIDDRIHNRITGSGLQVQNATGTTATLRIYDEIGFFGITAEDVARALDQITADSLEVQISSLGGDVFDGVAIYNALRAHPATVTTRVDSMAASVSSVIAQAGDRRLMLSGSQMMIHEAHGLALGNAEDHRKHAERLDKQTGIIADIYAERADGSAEAFRDLMEGETWMDADETVEAGLADEVVNPSEKPADRWHNKFSDQLATVVTAVEKVAEETENVMTFRSQQGKPPLSDEAQELLDRALTALSGLTDEVEPEKQPEDSSFDFELARLEWEERRYKEVS